MCIYGIAYIHLLPFFNVIFKCFLFILFFIIHCRFFFLIAADFLVLSLHFRLLRFLRWPWDSQEKLDKLMYSICHSTIKSMDLIMTKVHCGRTKYDNSLPRLAPDCPHPVLLWLPAHLGFHTQRHEKPLPVCPSSRTRSHLKTLHGHLRG